MRIAYLILAHNHPELLLRLLKALEGPGTGIYVHLDKKADATRFPQAQQAFSNVNFIDKRRSVYWMGFSAVQATLDLLRLAHSSGKYDYYILLSGADYPIKPAEYIERFLATSEKDFLFFFNLADWPSWRSKIDQYHYTDTFWTNYRTAPRRSWRLYRRVQQLLARLLPPRKFLPQLEPYGGSQWWMLTRDSVTWLLDFLKMHRGFSWFYRFTESPDEMFFQTAVLNSPRREMVQNYLRYQELWADIGAADDNSGMETVHQFNLRYIDWDTARERPAVLDERDFERLSTSPCLFARKMDPVRSAKLLDRIDEELRSQ